MNFLYQFNFSAKLSITIRPTFSAQKTLRSRQFITVPGKKHIQTAERTASVSSDRNKLIMEWQLEDSNSVYILLLTNVYNPTLI